ncbi:MAG: hypothetical protein ACKODW_01450 [Methylophilaceae bacterium]
MKKLALLVLLFGAIGLQAQQLAPLSVEKIMRDPKWMGVSPSNVQWSPDSRQVYFNWNPEAKDRDQLFTITPQQTQPKVAAAQEQKQLNRANITYNKNRTKALFERNGDLFLLDVASGKEQVLVNTLDRENGAAFSADERKVLFQRAENLYSLNLANGSLVQLTNFSRTRKRPEAQLSKQDQWLKADQLKTFEVLQKEAEEQKADAADRRLNEAKRPKEFVVDDRSQVNTVRLSPDERYIAFRVTRSPEGNQNTIVPNFITASGYTEDIPGRTKVGNALPTSQSFIYDLSRDSIYAVSTKEIPGLKDLPDYVK